MPQSPLRSPFFARSRPAAVALLVLIAALSARESPSGGEAGRAEAGWAEAGWPVAGGSGAAPVTAGEREGAMLAAAGVLDSDVVPVQAMLAREAAGDVAMDGAPSALAGYPHPVEYLTVEVDGAPTPLAFMDVPPTGPVNGRAVLLLHDRDGAGDAWASTIAALATDGYRVIVPDQVGHGLSGRVRAALPPATLAAQAAVLLDSIGAPRVAVVGDGLGADVAVRLAGANTGLVDRMALLPREGVPAPPAAELHDPVRGRPVPVIVVGGEGSLDPLLLDFLGR